jgi:DedD protein
VNGRYDSDNDLRDLHDTEGHDREISLGTTTILGIFFLLALLCAVFFGFGYSMGRRSSQNVASVPVAESTYDTTSSKPAPGSPMSRGIAFSSGSKEVPEEASARTVESASAQPQAPRSTSSTQVEANAAIKSVSTPKPMATTGTPGTGSFVVQVAAVSHPEDATVLTNALKKRGYGVVVRQTQQDKLLHVQIGPFASKKEAEVMRQRLLADGYNAIVK